MAMTNAQRQARWRERNKIRRPAEGLPLSREQVQDREKILGLVPQAPSEPLSQDLDLEPRFMGWTRCQWISAPEEILRHFGLYEALEQWKSACRDRRKPLSKQFKLGRPRNRRQRKIVSDDSAN
jgi:hypothetical protein